MNQNETLNISTNQDNWLIEIKPCIYNRDAEFIRELTRENCYDYLLQTIGWNEKRQNQEPKFPERYLMLFDNNASIGFLSLREQPNCLYLETLQLIKSYRGQGIGTALIKFIEKVAARTAKDTIQLRVFKNSPAQSLYRRCGFILLEEEEWFYLMEKVVTTP
ncbi:MAG: GNAT family N-acetyltransferase [Waterburya sp.]